MIELDQFAPENDDAIGDGTDFGNEEVFAGEVPLSSSLPMAVADLSADINKVEYEDTMSFVDSDAVAAQFLESSSDREEVYSGASILAAGIEAGEGQALDQFLDTGVGCLGICNVRCITYKCNGKGMNR